MEYVLVTGRSQGFVPESATGAVTNARIGDGQAVVRKVCTKCHSLEGLPMYKGYYDRSRWLLFVETMLANGATLNEEEKDLVVDYLTENFGTN